ncbi:MAG: hypothetical protein AAGE98_14070 [Actinomycetota bacterium]
MTAEVARPRAVGRHPGWAHAGVAAITFVAVVAWSDVGRFYLWDEAVYASQLSGSHEPVEWRSQRAPGVVYLVAPVTLLTDSIVAVRLWLGIAGSLATAAAFAVWHRSVGSAALIAHVLFVTTGLVAIYLTELFPNLWFALAALAAVGLVVDRTAMPPRLVATVAALVGAASLLRPSEAVALAVMVGAVLVLRLGTRALPSLLWIGAGYLVGITPWLIRSFTTFGGPLERLDDARSRVGTEPGVRILDMVRLLDDPFGNHRDGVEILSVGVGLWFLVWMGCAIVGAVRSPRLASPVVIALASALALAVPFAFFKEHPAPRFLLPAIALLAIAAGAGLQRLSGTTRRAVLAGVVLSVLVIAQFRVYDDFREINQVARSRYLALGTQVDVLADGEDCLVISRRGGGQLAFLSGCDWAGGEPEDALDDGVHEPFLERGAAVFVVVSEADRVPDGWSSWSVAVDDPFDWHVARHPGAP